MTIRETSMNTEKQRLEEIEVNKGESKEVNFTFEINEKMKEQEYYFYVVILIIILFLAFVTGYKVAPDLYNNMFNWLPVTDAIDTTN